MIFATRMKLKKLPSILTYCTLLWASLIYLTPFVWTLLTSLKSDPEIYSTTMKVFPGSIFLEHYTGIFQSTGHFSQYFTNSVIITSATILLVLILSASSGYAFASLDFPGRAHLLFFCVMIITVPLAIYLIPIYLMEDRLNLINTHLGLILPYTAVNLPMAVLIMRASFRKIPTEIEEVAILDGCNLFQVWYRILLPLVTPGLSVVCLFSFINVWGEFMFARTLANTQAAQTLPVGITFLRDEAASWQYGRLSAVIVLSLIPLLGVFLCLQKYLLKGLPDGGSKG